MTPKPTTDEAESLITKIKHAMRGSLMSIYVEKKCCAWLDELASLKAPAAEGWVLVPVEATREMCVAAVKFANGDAVYKNVAAGALEIEEKIYAEVYEAMLAAAPQEGTT